MSFHYYDHWTVHIVQNIWSIIKIWNSDSKNNDIPIFIKFDTIDNIIFNNNTQWLKLDVNKELNNNYLYELILPQSLYFIHHISVILDVMDSLNVKKDKIRPQTLLVLNLNIIDENNIGEITDKIINIYGIKNE